MSHDNIVKHMTTVIVAALLTFLITIVFVVDRRDTQSSDLMITDQPPSQESESYKQIQEFRIFLQDKSLSLQQYHARRAANESSINWGSWNRDQLECLAANIYHESRGEPLEGQVAVATVTLNRVHDERWPSTICGVVQQKAQVAMKDQQGQILDHKTVCQFSWACDPSLGQTRNSLSWRRSIKLATAVLQGEHDHLAVNYQSALYFHTVHATPRWSSNTKMIKRVGSHVFRGDV